MTACEQCRNYERRIAQLERDLEAAALAVDHMTNKWAEAKETLAAIKEGKGKK